MFLALNQLACTVDKNSARHVLNLSGPEMSSIQFFSTNPDMRMGRVLTGIMIAVSLLVFGLLSGCNSTDLSNSSTSSASAGSELSGSYANITKVDSLPPPARTGKVNEPRISADDLLDISIFQVKGMDRTVLVDTAGAISLPLIGEVKAAGLTVKQLEQSLETRYGENYLQSPEISVFMKESAGQRITVDGEFNKTGRTAVGTNSTLMQVVAQAGGLTALGDEEKIFVYRKYPDGTKVANYSISKIRKGTLRVPNIYCGDVIVSFKSGSKVALSNLQKAMGLTLKAAAIGAL